MVKRGSRGFTLIELLVVVAIIALLISILLPSLSGARNRAKSIKCLANLKSQGEMTLMYLQDNADEFPTRLTGSGTGGGSVYGAFHPTRTILKTDKRPVGMLTCPSDGQSVRDYALGKEDGSNPESLGIAEFYEMDPATKVRYSYGINNMTGINPATDAERLIFNPSFSAYPHPARTLMYADCAWVNARGHNLAVNDSLLLKARVANAGAPHRMNTLSTIPAEYAQPIETYARHPKGNNIAFMDNHAETVSQTDALAPAKVLYSWTEPVDFETGDVDPGTP